MSKAFAAPAVIDYAVRTIEDPFTLLEVLEVSILLTDGRIITFNTTRETIMKMING